MENYCSFIAAALLLVISSFTQSFGETFFNLTTDEHALLAFAVTSDPYSVLIKNWPSTNTSICYWIGVSCGTKHRRVIALNVSGFELQGTIAPHLGNLTFLRSLDLSFNNFTGLIPSELSNLRRLKEINIGVNSFTGEIPPWLGSLPQLEKLYLYNNTFSGRIPPSFFNISRLHTLNIEYNILDGIVPVEIANFSLLETVRLSGNKFTGPFPYGMFNMSFLIEIDLRKNRLSGKLPNDICTNTPKLKKIYLSANQFYGEIPTNIYKCRELEDLRLSGNHFNGNIPREIGSLPMLRILSLWSNYFKGGIPKEIGYLTSLEYLDLSSNNLTGELPQEIGNLSSLDRFSVFNNSLFGSIPSSIFNISALKMLELSFNQFSGSLPSDIGFSLFNLELLYLARNRFIGPIPSSITNLSMLTVLSLEQNSFSGSIPNFGNLRLLKNLRIWGNHLSGSESATQELGFLSSLTNCRYLQLLEISFNPLNGVLPASIGNLSTSLRSFVASGCNIKGHIPTEIGNLSSLIDMHMNWNEFNGYIPTTLGKLKLLQMVSLVGNRLEGNIPHHLCQLSSLGNLYLSDNMLTGTIPECMGEMTSLREIDLWLNKLNSTVPNKVWNLKDLLSLDLSSNYLSGRLSPSIANLKTIYQLNLSSNQFSGDIPSSIDGCQSLEYLFLSNNKFEGSIPQSLGNVKGLSMLDLSNNNLSGLIPKSLEGLPFLQYFNISYNRLEGEIPNGGPFDNFTALSFVHNSDLCGATRFQVPPCHGRSRSKNAVQLLKYILTPIIATIILVIIIVMVIIRRFNQRPILSPTEIQVGISWRRIPYAELSRGTSEFSEANLLGRGSFGSVFKATLSDGSNVAVKVFNLQLEGASKSFDTESEILGSIRHRNLVRVIGCCSNTEFKGLILAYMPNGSLEKWLYSETCCLDMLQRLKIAIDVALALEYLHHGYTFPVVHRDIKPSNVLLDEDMTAHIGDFGISKLFDEGETVIQTTTLATIGYTAPEHGSEGQVSTNGDVYSYGIMLLEIFTRKKPTDDMFSEEMNLKEWVRRAIQENAESEVVAAGLLSRKDQDFWAKEQCVSSIFDLAMKCSAFSPMERINMKQAVAALHKIKAQFLASIKMKR